MSDKLLKNIAELQKSTESNTERVRKSMTRPGHGEPDSAVVDSIAKYYQAIERLAGE